ncbi:hypothetical protein ACFD7L_004285 [Vibrio vulnificus]
MINNKDILNKMGFLIALLALLVTSYGVWEQVREKYPEVTVSLLSEDKVTDLANIKGLVATYSFNGEAIQDLWKIQVRFQNTGDKTIIGSGSKSDLIKDSLDFSFPKGFRVIDLNELDDSVRAQVKPSDDHSFNIRFEQWRSEEHIDIELFLEQMDHSLKSPKISLASRSLIDGNFILSMDNPLAVVKRKSLLNLPTPIVEWSSTFVFILKLAMFGLLLYVVTLGLKESLSYYNWKKRYKQDFDKHIDYLFSNYDEEKFSDISQNYKDDPCKAPKWVWDDFSGEKVAGIVLFPTTKSTIVFFIVSWLFVIASLVSTLG